MLFRKRATWVCREPSSNEPAVLGRARFASCAVQIHNTACSTAHVRLYPSVSCILGLRRSSSLAGRLESTSLTGRLQSALVIQEDCSQHLSYRKNAISTCHTGRMQSALVIQEDCSQHFSCRKTAFSTCHTGRLQSALLLQEDCSQHFCRTTMVNTSLARKRLQDIQIYRTVPIRFLLPCY